MFRLQKMDSAIAKKHVKISVDTVPCGAFENDKVLESISFLSTNLDDAMAVLGTLDKLNIPNGLAREFIHSFYLKHTTVIGSRAFYYCSSLTSITLPNSLTTIGDKAFYYCSSLTSITLPNSLTTIGKNAFFRCSSLTSITLPDSLTTIGDGAFDGCSSLTSITLPNSLTTATLRWTFDGCSSLTSITLPDSVTTIGEWAFDCCSSLTSITLPDSVTTIGRGAFRDCSSLTSITLPDSLTTIEENAFYNCSSLTSITLSNASQLTTIEENAFYNCSSLPDVAARALLHTMHVLRQGGSRMWLGDRVLKLRGVGAGEEGVVVFTNRDGTKIRVEKASGGTWRLQVLSNYLWR